MKPVSRLRKKKNKRKYNPMRQVVFLIRTVDRKGLLAAISGFFYSRDLNIIECRQYTDVLANEYFTRILVDLPSDITRTALEAEFSAFAAEYQLNYAIHYIGDIRNVAVRVSKPATASTICW